MISKPFIDIIEALRAYINGMVPDSDVSADFEKVFDISKKHNLTAIMTSIWEKSVAEKNAEIAKRLQDEKNITILKNVSMDVEREQIESFFEEYNIWYMPLKGLILRNYYPEPELREMADNDILIDKEYQEKVHDFMIRRGYSIKDYGIGNCDEYLKKPLYNFEIHTELFDDYSNKEWSDYYSNIKNKLLKNGLKCSFSKEDFYIYYIIHTYKHFLNGGMGIRTMLDAYLFWNKEKDNLDISYIEQELIKLKALDFENEFRLLFIKVFENDNWHNELSESEAKMAGYIFKSGTYGLLENNILNQMGCTSKNDKSISVRIKYIFRRVFPKVKFMKKFYPSVTKHVILIPYAYVYRIIKILISNRAKAFTEIRLIWKKK